MGYALTTQWEGVDAKSQQVIGFDMGGTSTDVSRFAGSYEHVFESVTAGTALGCCWQHLLLLSHTALLHTACSRLRGMQV